MIDPLPRNDRLHLNAAEGWVGLGNPAEAMSELEMISEEYRRDPVVLQTFWAVYAQWEKWKPALEVAQKLVELCPEISFGWVHRAYALRRVEGGGLEKAWDLLLPAAVRFPDEPIIPYNLACYCAQLNKLGEARDWLAKAMAIGHPKTIRDLAMRDPDLEPLRAIGYLK
jgi:predicted Zn-dependent protease